MITVIALIILLRITTAYSFVSLHSNFLSRDTSKLFGAGFGAKRVTPTEVTLITSSYILCPCGSGLTYGMCCEPYHNQSLIPSNPVLLVRSRFSSLAIGNVTYIMETTHPTHPEFSAVEQKGKRTIWQRHLETYVKEYEFQTLSFMDETVDSAVSDDATEATVSFVAKIKSRSPNSAVDEIRESSTFKKTDDGRWLYADGDVTISSQGRATAQGKVSTSSRKSNSGYNPRYMGGGVGKS